MTDLTLPAAPDDAHRVAPAIRHSSSAEARAVARDNARPGSPRRKLEKSVGVVGAIAAAAREAGLTNEDVVAIEESIAEQREAIGKRNPPAVRPCNKKRYSAAALSPC